MKEDKIKELERERDFWKDCYENTLNQLKQIEDQFLVEHGYSFKYKENRR